MAHQPKKAALLSHGEVQSALRKAVGPNATLRTFRTSALAAGKVGFMGEHCDVEVEFQEARISYQAHDKINFFMKRVPEAETFRQFITRFGLFAKEREMYEKLLPLMCQSLRVPKLSVPECYVVCDNSYLLFEHLGCKGYRLLDKHQHLDMDQCRAVVEAVAQLHAGSVAVQARSGKMMTFHMRHHQEVVIVKERRAATNIAAYWHAASQATALGLLLKMQRLRPRVARLPREVLRQKIGKAWDAAAEMAAGFSSRFANVLSHGDLWINNVMFKPGPAGKWKAMLVDFQTYRYAPPILDLLSFLHLTTSRKFRWNHQSEILKFYHKTLVGFLEKAEIDPELAPPLEEIERSAFEFRLFGIAIAARYMPTVLKDASSEEGAPDVELSAAEKDGMPQEFIRDSSDSIINAFARSPSMQARVEESLEELLEILEL